VLDAIGNVVSNALGNAATKKKKSMGLEKTSVVHCMLQTASLLVQLRNLSTLNFFAMTENVKLERSFTPFDWALITL